MEKLRATLVAIVVAVVVQLGLGLLLAWPTAVVWNYVFQPSATLALIGAPQMDSWHAFWIPVLVRCVGLSGGGSSK